MSLPRNNSWVNYLNKLSMAPWIWAAALLVPFLTWKIVWFGGSMSADNVEYYHWTAYYFENILNGVNPLWNPFRSWGSLDYLDVQYIGAYNPLMLVVAVLMSLGVDTYWAYITFIVLFWIAGFYGYFLLLRQVHDDARLAWLGSGLLMFTSALAIEVSWQLLLLYIFVPLGWFFGFLIGFVRADDDGRRRRHALGLTFATMLVLNFYIPFYFLTVLGVFMVSVLVCARSWIRSFASSLMLFIRRSPLLALFCALSILAAAWPMASCYFTIRDPQNVSIIGRGSEAESAAVVSLDMINAGGMPSHATFRELFSSYEDAAQHMALVPIMVFILALVAIGNRSSRAQAVIFLSGGLLLLIGVASATMVLPFLYKHLFFFKLFRNYFFFWPIFWAVVIVFLMGELKVFLARDLTSPKAQRSYILFVVLAHLLLGLFLARLEGVPLVSYVTLGLSAAWFLARLHARVRERTGLFIVVLWVIALLQPFYAMSFIHGMFGKGGALKHERRTVEFSYQRPAFGSGFNEEHAYNHRLKYRKDESGYVSEGFFGQRGSYLIRKEVPAGVLGDYVRHKFVLYCSTRTMDPGNVEWGAVSRALSFRDKAAIVHDAGGDPAFAEACRPHPVEGAADGVRVIRFDVNTIELEVDLPYRKFLVYNDSYHTGWRAFIDGKRVKLYQANIAFKGVWVEKGRHRVLFRFGTAMGRLSAFGFTAFYLIWAVIVAMAFLRAFRPREAYV